MNNSHKLICLDDLNKFDFIFFLDCEYTCWEGSLRTMWANPDYPPELLQIGIAIFDLNEKKYLEKFVSYVQPTINEKLSRYCINLLNITQGEIDNANDFLTVTNEITRFIEPYLKQQHFICSWGKDYINVSENAKWNKTKDPFLNIDKMNLLEEARKVLSIENIYLERDYVKEILHLENIANRHDALYDAVELLSIMNALINYD